MLDQARVLLPVSFGYQLAERTARQLRWCIAENLFSGEIRENYQAAAIDCDDRVGQQVEHFA